jgi:hypothetical protein
MSRFRVKDLGNAELLRIMDTESDTRSHVVGYVEPVIREDTTGHPWCAWFIGCTNIRPFPAIQPLVGGEADPSGSYAEFPSKEQAIAAVEALNICFYQAECPPAPTTSKKPSI